jgi:hypothetical protein
MDAKHEILLEQMLEELRAQTRALYELQRRMDEIERTLARASEDAKSPIGTSDR